MSFFSLQGISQERLTRSLALGAGAAFLPFPGFQTFFFFPLCAIFRLNFPVVYLASWINNPLTMGPIAFLELWTGFQIFRFFDLCRAPAGFSLDVLGGWSGYGGWSMLGAFLLGSVPYMIAVSLLFWIPARLLARRWVISRWKGTARRA